MNFPNPTGLFTLLGLSKCFKSQQDQVFGAYGSEIFYKAKLEVSYFLPSFCSFLSRNVKTLVFIFLIVAQICHKLHSDNLIQLLIIILGILNADVMYRVFFSGGGDEKGEEALTLQYLKPRLTSSSTGNLKDVFSKSRCINTYGFIHKFTQSSLLQNLEE